MVSGDHLNNTLKLGQLWFLIIFTTYYITPPYMHTDVYSTNTQGKLSMLQAGDSLRQHGLDRYEIVPSSACTHVWDSSRLAVLCENTVQSMLSTYVERQ